MVTHFSAFPTYSMGTASFGPICPEASSMVRSSDPCDASSAENEACSAASGPATPIPSASSMAAAGVTIVRHSRR